MDHLWIVVVLVAAAMQTGRNAGQKHLSGHMSALAATWVRFGFGLPFAFGYLAWALLWFDLSAPALAPSFLIPAAIAAFIQIAATLLLIFLFRMRNFAVGSTYVRSETIMAAILGSLVFGETIDYYGWLAILISVTGVLILSWARAGANWMESLGSLMSASAGVGLLAGLGFALSSFFIREASLSFGHSNFYITASITLMTVILLQTVCLGLFIVMTSRDDVAKIIRLWKPSLFVGATSAFGSMCWFTAMTIQRVTYVKALAQIEFIFALSVSILFFNERPTQNECVGMILVAFGIVVLVLFAE